MPSKAQEGAKRKGHEAAKRGDPRIPPYEDKRTSHNNGVTFSESFIKMWLEGYDSFTGTPDNHHPANCPHKGMFGNDCPRCDPAIPPRR